MKQKIIELLESINRKGMDKMIEWLIEKGYFESPASSKYHGAYKGGLMEHSYNLLGLLNGRKKGLKISDNELPEDTMIITALLHDICKVCLYSGTSKPYKCDYVHIKKGHAKLNLEIIEQFIELSHTETIMIKYHMGVYGTEEFSKINKYSQSEYSLKELIDAGNDRLVKLFHWCDDTASQFIDK